MVFLPGDHALDTDITVANASYLTIIGMSSLANVAKIVCNGSVGISFTDIVDFKMYSLTFMSCSRKLAHSPVCNYALLLQSTQYAELVNCSFCDNLGTALAVINTNITLVGNNEFTDNHHEQQLCGGGGIGAFSSNLTFIGNSTFFKNFASSYGGGAIYTTENSLLHFIGTNSFIGNSAHWGHGGAIYASHNTVFTFNGINNFINNSVNHSRDGGGAIYTSYDTILSFNGTNNFVNNSANNGNDKGGGGAIYASENTTLIFDGTNNFISNSADHNIGGGGSIYALGNASLSFNGNNNFINNSIDNLEAVGGTILASDHAVLSFTGTSNFINNSAHSGGVMYALDTILTLNGTNNFTSNSANYGDGGAIYTSGNTVFSFSGTNTFTNNLASEFGGAICADTNSRLMLNGTIKFTNNGQSRGKKDTLSGNTICGGGVYVGLQSTLSILPRTAVYWEKNHANLGGAIYVVDASPLSYCTGSVARHVPKEECFFQICDQNLSNINAQFVFINNTADAAGSVLYGSAIDNCKLTGLVSYKSGIVFDMLVHTNESYDNTNSNVSSDPIHIHLCEHKHYYDVYPGETFQVCAVAFGQRHGRVPSTVRSTIDQQKSELFGYQYLQSTKNTCTKLNYTVFSLSRYVHIRLYPEGSPCSKFGNKYQTTIYVNLKQTCPPGFCISESTKSCVCEPRLALYTNQCNITNGLGQITRNSSQHFWVGYDNRSHGLILHPRCPFDYCVTGTVVFPLNNTNNQCAYNRSDLLCGACKSGYSLVFGTSQCKPCTNNYLLLLIPFAVMGLALVFLLLAFKMTVATGTLSGLLFYVNIVEVNYTIFMPEKYTDYLSVFIAWLNLDLGIETCFYNGMDAYSKTWLQFVFPVYIWVIIGLTTVVSHYSHRFASLLGNNPVSVLATLILLSYAKILRTFIAVIYITYLEYPNDHNRKVWLYDANIDYLSGKHIPLFIVALVVFFFLFFPYTLLLLFGQWLQAISHMRLFSWVNSARLKPFMDSYHAPYKAKHRYWPGLLLMFRFVLFLVFALNPSQDPSINLLAILVGTGILVVWAWVCGGVYRNWCLGALEGSFALNLIILAVATYHVEHSKGNQLAVGYTSVSIALVTFIGIVAYHTLVQLRYIKLLKKPNLNFWFNRKDIKQPANISNNQMGNSTMEEADFDQLRESLLDDQPQPSYGAF